ncbi:hypothetical protein SCHPADRAFT_894299 [Schizopora paradoxa]|uniref:Uncharacterized protein n=1 Tax=Schizopora paradoxa TaxID=27342 RepID=A0A0H2R7L4_9AGAM|nr:hypothetical protein SCHPADRAFT_894299 [Schizopora paradoxa]
MHLIQSPPPHPAYALLKTIPGAKPPTSSKPPFVASLVEQSVKSLTEIWRPEFVPPVFCTSTQVSLADTTNASSTTQNPRRATLARKPTLQLPSPCSPSTQPSPPSYSGLAQATVFFGDQLVDGTVVTEKEQRSPERSLLHTTDLDAAARAPTPSPSPSPSAVPHPPPSTSIEGSFMSTATETSAVPASSQEPGAGGATHDLEAAVPAPSLSAAPLAPLSGSQPSSPMTAVGAGPTAAIGMAPAELGASARSSERSLMRPSPRPASGMRTLLRWYRGWLMWNGEDWELKENSRYINTVPSTTSIANSEPVRTLRDAGLTVVATATHLATELREVIETATRAKLRIVRTSRQQTARWRGRGEESEWNWRTRSRDDDTSLLRNETQPLPMHSLHCLLATPSLTTAWLEDGLWKGALVLVMILLIIVNSALQTRGSETASSIIVVDADAGDQA